MQLATHSLIKSPFYAFIIIKYLHIKLAIYSVLYRFIDMEELNPFTVIVLSFVCYYNIRFNFRNLSYSFNH